VLGIWKISSSFGGALLKLVEASNEELFHT